MPESKHRRKNKNRARSRHVTPPPSKPAPSPRWVPVTGASLLGAGVVTILLGYVPLFRNASFIRNLPWLGANWSLVLGFLLLTGGFAVLTRWR